MTDANLLACLHIDGRNLPVTIGEKFVAPKPRSGEGGPCSKHAEPRRSGAALEASLHTKPVFGPPGLAVSPDGRAVLYVQRDSFSSDIMILENFR